MIKAIKQKRRKAISDCDKIFNSLEKLEQDIKILEENREQFGDWEYSVNFDYLTYLIDLMQQHIVEIQHQIES